MSELPASPKSWRGRLLPARLRLARAALFWERLWPAAWPALCVLGIFAVLALFDLLPLLPGAVHAAVLAAFGLAFIGAVFWGWRRIYGPESLPDRIAARRRIERSSGLPHRPLAALADRPSAPLDSDAAALWEAHQRRMAAAAQRLRVRWAGTGPGGSEPGGGPSRLAHPRL